MLPILSPEDDSIRFPCPSSYNASVPLSEKDPGFM